MFNRNSDTRDVCAAVEKTDLAGCPKMGTYAFELRPVGAFWPSPASPVLFMTQMHLVGASMVVQG